jgi:hypothetical protein
VRRPVRFRLYVDGQLVDDVTVPLGGVRDLIGQLGAEHGEIAAAAQRAGRPYLLEIRFWDGEHARFGTDAAGMVEPFAVGLERLLEILERRYSS